MPPLNQLVQDISTIGGFNSKGLQVCVTGTAVSLVPAVQIAPTYNLTRKPATSSATITSGVLTPDVAGLYQITVTNGGVAVALNLIAAPAALFAIQTGGLGLDGTSPVRHPFGPAALLQILTFSIDQWTPASFLATVEAQPTAVGVHFGFNLGLVGGANTSPLSWAAYSP